MSYGAIYSLYSQWVGSIDRGIIYQRMVGYAGGKFSPRKPWGPYIYCYQDGLYHIIRICPI